MDLSNPVRNLGGATIFTESWASGRLEDGDAWADVWSASGCGTGGATASSATGLALSPGCSLVTVPHEARTFNFFRHPLTLTVEDVRVTTGVALIGLTVPSSVAVNSTAWPRVGHYLQPLRNDSIGQTRMPAAGLAATISADGAVELRRRQFAGGPVTLLGSANLPAGCGRSEPASVHLFAGSVFTVAVGQNSGGSPAPPMQTRLNIFCGGRTAQRLAVNISSDLGLGFLDRNGFGETVGEAVLELRAVNQSNRVTKTAHDTNSSKSAVAIGKIRITNDLEKTFSPAVLAPITDRVGTVSWDNGVLGLWHSDASKPNMSPDKDGILDVTMPPFEADSSGVTDATVALQSAIDFARHNYLSIWLPAGEYKVTASLQALQHPRQSGNGFAGLNLSANFCFNRFTSWTIRGEVLASDTAAALSRPMGRGRPGRATLVLPPNTPAFALFDGSKTPPLAVLNVSSVNSHFELEPNVLMNTIVQSVDIAIGAGNPAAVGIRMRGAQGSGLEDISVVAAEDAFAGISGVSGSGGAHSNITVVGARFGVDARDTQPSATLTNVRLINQSCAALIHEGLETLTVAGLFVQVDGIQAEPGAAAVVSGSPSEQASASLPALPAKGKCAPLLSPQTNVGQSAYIAGTLSIVDAGFECLGCSRFPRTAVAGSRNTYIRRGVMIGFDTILSASDPNNVSKVLFTLPSRARIESSGGTRVNELSVALPTRPGTINGTAYINGKAIVSVTPIVNVSEMQSVTSSDLTQGCERLGWGDNHQFPTHATPGTNVRDYGAKGDGRHDDTESIQRAVDAAAAQGGSVFLSRGVFRTSSTVVVPRGVKIIGLGRHLTMLVANDAEFRGSVREDSRQFDRSSVVGDAPPLLLFSNDPAKKLNTSIGGGNLLHAKNHDRGIGIAETVVFGMSLVVPAYNVHGDASMLVFRASAADGFNVFRQMWTARLNLCGQYWGDQCSERFFAQVPYRNAYMRIEGEATTLRMYVYYQEDSENSVGTTSQSAFQRKLLIEGTRRPIEIHQLNGEHSHTTAYTEIVNATDVSVLGCKSERDGPVIFLRNVSRFASYGHGGAAHEILSKLPAQECNGHAPCPWSPSLYRVIDSDDIRFVNLQMQFYAGSNSMMYEKHGGEVATAPKGEWPSLWFRTPQ